MAEHLARKGFALRVYNRSVEKTSGFSALGATVCATPAEAAAGADFIAVCVTDGPDVEAVLFGERGATTTAKRGALIADHSTIPPSMAVRIETRCRELGFRFLDAPVSGGQKGACEGVLSVMCGGASEDFEAARPFFSAYGRSLTLIGGPGMGQVAKCCNQTAGIINLLGLCEALSLAKRMGADPMKVREALRGGVAGSWAVENHWPRMVGGDDAPGFFVSYQLKDLRIVLETAAEKSLPLPALSLARELLKAVEARGGGRLGVQALRHALDVLAGEDWRGPDA
jgi:3-hydroxyisobutyrate dehydrogenase